MKNEFKNIVNRTGLKHKKVSEILNVSIDTVNAYASGRRPASKKNISILQAVETLIDAKMVDKGGIND